MLPERVDLVKSQAAGRCADSGVQERVRDREERKEMVQESE